MTPAAAPVPTTPGVVGEDLRGSLVVVTGVGRPGQTGEAVAAALARRGANLALVDRDRARAEARALDVRRFGPEVAAFGCDLADPDDVHRLATRVAGLSSSGVKALVHLAGGYADGGSVAETDAVVLHRLVTINLTTAFVTSRAFLPLLRSARGSLVFFGAAVALPGAGVAKLSAYAAAKGGVVTLMRAIAAEERDAGLRANALAPQAIRTESNLRTMGEGHRYVDRETVAEWVVWLCSAASGPVNGQAIRLG